jgi:hypothetical protein
MEFRGENADEKSHEKSQYQERFQRTNVRATPFTDLDTLIFHVFKIAETFQGRRSCFGVCISVLKVLLGQHFKVETQLFVDLTLNRFAAAGSKQFACKVFHRYFLVMQFAELS